MGDVEQNWILYVHMILIYIYILFYYVILYYIILYYVVYIYWLMKIGDQNPWSNQYQGISILQMLYEAPWLSMTSGRLTVVPGSTARTRWTILVKRRSNHRKPTVIGCTRPGKHTKKLLKMAINSWFTHEKWWISMVMFVYQRAKPRGKAYWATLFRPRMATIGPSKFASYFWQAWKVMNRICREARIPQSSHNSVRFVFMSMYYGGIGYCGLQRMCNHPGIHRDTLTTNLRGVFPRTGPEFSFNRREHICWWFQYLCWFF